MKSKPVQFTIELRGQMVNVSADVHEPDSQVGYMHSYIDEESLVLTDAEGAPLEWILTQDEWELLNGAIPEDFYDQEDDDGR